jgi:anti-sigma B factor antagonist
MLDSALPVKPVRVMDESAEHPADRFPSTRDGRSTFSVRLLAMHEHDPDAVVLSVHGDVDLLTAPLLREAMLPVLTRQRGLVVVDLSEVAFMDSSGIHVLVEALERLASQNRRLAIACREYGQIHGLLALVGLLATVTVHSSRDGAVMGGEDRIHLEPPARRSRRYVANQRSPRRSSQPVERASRG